MSATLPKTDHLTWIDDTVGGMAAERVGTGRGPYAKSARQRERIIATALEYFGQQGYHGTSMREIARETGLSQAGLLHHFPSKADLLIAVLGSRDTLTGATARAAAERTADPLASLVAVVEENASQRELVRMFVVVSAEATDEHHPAHAYFQRRAHHVIELMRSCLQQAVDQGLTRGDLDIDLAARQCQALMYGLQVQWLFDPSTDMAAVFRRFVDELAAPRDLSKSPGLSAAVRRR
jgi:AcrR family transcriptional regulator